MAEKEPTEAPDGHAAAPASSDEKLDRLREIIFGTELIDSARESARLEELIANEIASVQAEIAEISRAFEERIQGLDERFSKAQSDLREQLVSQFNLLNDTLQERSEQAKQALESGLAQVQESKIDRKAFAELLMQLAGQLHHDGEASSLASGLRSSWRPSRSSP